MKLSQRQFIINELLASGHISRNYCLSLYFLKIRPSITKLATLISDLRLKEHWNIEPREERDSNGNKDMVYFVVSSPMKKITYSIPELNKTITIFK